MVGSSLSLGDGRKKNVKNEFQSLGIAHRVSCEAWWSYFIKSIHHVVYIFIYCPYIFMYYSIYIKHTFWVLSGLAS